MRLSLRTAGAGAVYAAIGFGIGFLLGTVRTLVVAPRIGALAAVALEIPLMLAAAWIVCGRVMDRFGVLRESGARWRMALTAFATVMVLEFGVASLIFGTSPGTYLDTWGTAAGTLGLAGQIGFALIPLFRGRRGG